MRDQMKKGQLAFFYHSNCKNPGIAGIMEVIKHSSYQCMCYQVKFPYAQHNLLSFSLKQIVKESYVDDTQFDKADPHYDP